MNTLTRRNARIVADSGTRGTLDLGEECSQCI
jgi:hypothetical protein